MRTLAVRLGVSLMYNYHLLSQRSKGYTSLAAVLFALVFGLFKVLHFKLNECYQLILPSMDSGILVGLSRSDSCIQMIVLVRQLVFKCIRS